MATSQGGAAGAIKQNQLMPARSADDESATTDDQPFRFMDLPREMRDHVFEHLKKDSKIVREGAIELYLEGGPRLPLLLVSHQFNREYLDSVTRDAKISGIDCADNETEVDPIIPIKIDAGQHAAFKFARDATLNSIALCHQSTDHGKCNAKGELEKHVSWVSDLLQGLPQLKHTELGFMVCIGDPDTFRRNADVEHITEEWPADVRGHSLAAILQECTSKVQNAATTIKVYCRSIDSRGYEDLQWSKDIKVAKAYCTWTSVDGWTAGVEEKRGDEED